MSTFNEDGSGDVYTIGISMLISMVQYHDSFSWSKLCHCLFPNDLSRMVSEMNNVNDLFHQNMTEFPQTDIDGSVIFVLNAITIESLDKYLKTFIRLHWTLIKYLPFGIKFFSIQKTSYTVIEEVWEFASKATIIPFSIFTSMFH
jgi:hypothetical protein